jgi:hypothetical protein
MPLANRVKPLPEPDPEPAPPALKRGLSGLSLKPSEAVDPYQYRRFVPEVAGIEAVTVWCPRCDHGLALTDLYMSEEGLVAIGICETCIDRGGEHRGIYRAVRVPLALRRAPKPSDV